MIPLFPYLHIVEAVLYALIIALGLWAKGRVLSDTAVMVVMLASALLVYFSVRLAAVLRHQKIVNILFRKLDPDAFLAAYEPVMTRAKGNVNLENTTRNYASTAYACKGDFETAKDLLENAPEVTGKQALRGNTLKMINLCNLYLLQMDLAKADESLKRLRGLAAGEGSEKVNTDLKNNIYTLDTYLKAARGWNADEKYLKRIWLRSDGLYHKVNIRYWLGLAQIGNHERDQARESLKWVAEQAPDLYVGQEAARRLEILDRKKPAEEPVQAEKPESTAEEPAEMHTEKE